MVNSLSRSTPLHYSHLSVVLFQIQVRCGGMAWEYGHAASTQRLPALSLSTCSCVVLPTRGDGGPEQLQRVGTSADQLNTGGSRRDLRLKVPQIVAAHLNDGAW